MKTKLLIITLLVFVNVSLLTVLIVVAVPDRPVQAGTALAQAMPGSPKYLMAMGRYRQNEQAIYVVSLERRMLAVFTFDQAKKRLTYNGRASLAADFRQN